MRTDLPPSEHAKPRAKSPAAWALSATKPLATTTPQEPATKAEGRPLETDGRMRSPRLQKHQIASGATGARMVMRYPLEGRARGRAHMGPRIGGPNPWRQDRAKHSLVAKHGRNPRSALRSTASCELGTQANPKQARHLQGQAPHPQDARHILVGSSGLLGVAIGHGGPGHSRPGDLPTRKNPRPSI
jgi:hypothetical protein